MGNARPQEAIIKTRYKNVDIIPATNQLCEAELQLADVEQRNHQLRKIILQVKDNYDIVIVDCLPSLGILAINAMIACDRIIVPMVCEPFALEGLAQLMQTVKKVKRSANKELQLMGIVFTMLDKRLLASNEIMRDIKRTFPSDVIFKTEIPRNVRITEAQSHGEPIISTTRTPRVQTRTSALQRKYWRSAAKWRRRMSNKRIGGDFNSLFDDNNMEESEGLRTLRLSEIEPNKGQPRKVFDKEAMEQLAESIRVNGVLQPLLVRPLSTGNYQIVAGERRWRAAKIAGLAEVPVVVRDDLSDEQVMQVALIENLQRENLNPIEEAQGYKELIEKYNMTQDQLSKALGKARSSIANSLGLLTLPVGVRDLLADGKLSAGHCKALKMIKDPALMTEIAVRAADGELSVRSIEAIAKREAKSEEEQTMIKPRMAYYTEVEMSLTEALGTKVKICEGKKTNTLQIAFEDKDQLEGILRLMAVK